MRKYIITSLALLCGLFVFTGCDNYLDRYPKDGFNEQNSFKTETDLRFFVNGLYGNLPWSNYNSDNNSDNMTPATMNSLLADSYTVPSSGGGWSVGDWAEIRKCNLFLSRYEGAEVSDLIKDKYAAETRFFRALLFWNKTVRFGEVPIIKEYLTDASQTLYAPRETMDKVAEFIVEDLEFAIDKLANQSEEGRLNKDAALSLGSRICLWLGTYFKYHEELNYTNLSKLYLQKSKEFSARLMGGKYSLYTEGETPYRDLFIQENLTNNSEGIMIKRFIKSLSTHNYTRESTESNTGLSKDLVEDYLMTNGQPIGSNYDDSTPDKEFVGRDLRLAQTIAYNGFEWQEGETPYGLPQLGTKTTSGYWIIKGRSSKKEKMVSFNDDTDRFIFRYAEILLNYAEARYELGELTNDDLDKSINLLRSRAGIQSKLTMDVAADQKGLDRYKNAGIYIPEPILYEIRRERRIELIGEGFRFNDLLRWKAGKLINLPKTVLGIHLTDELRAEYKKAGIDISNVKVNAAGFVQVYPSLTTDTRNWLEKMYLYPLPLDQLAYKNSNGEFIYQQNPGW